MAANTPILDAHMHQWDLRSNPSDAAILVKLFGWNDSLKEWVGKLLFPKSTLRFVGKIDYVSNDYLIHAYRAELGLLASRFLGTVYVEAIWNATNHIAFARQTGWVAQPDQATSHYKVTVPQL